jgi:radical SAM protein with 4Fe4S-binding SPASM domain
MDNHVELPGKHIATLLIGSGELADDAKIAISGGEPFLKSDIADTVALLLQGGHHYSVLLSTNGTLPGKVEEMIDKTEDTSRLHIAISIDGAEKTHNRIRGNDNAFQAAIETVRIVCKYSVLCHVNVTVQTDNIDELKNLNAIVEKVSDGKAKIGYIPVIDDIARVRDVALCNADLRKIYKYIQAPKDIKRLASGGLPVLRGCHGGERNIVISPAGRVFTCQHRTCWKYDEAFCLGDMKQDALTDILASAKAQSARLAALNCEGCSCPYDVDREESLFGLSFALSDNETDYWYSLSNEPVAFVSGWYQNEKPEPEIFRWMSEETADIIIDNTQRYDEIELFFENYYPDNDASPLIVTVKYGEKSIEKVCDTGRNELLLSDIPCADRIKIALTVNRMWRPIDFSSSDTRQLGVAVSGIKMQSRN